MSASLNLRQTWAALTLSIAIVAVGSTSALQQPPTTFTDFTIIIEATDDGIQMKSTKGSAWVDLTFSLNKYRPQAIDEYGMADLGDVSASKSDDLADYLFTLIKTETGIQLRGIEGTAWTELSFSLSKDERKAIDRFGMVGE